ncbi:MAG: aminotransferase class IV [Bacteroidota bacterium]
MLIVNGTAVEETNPTIPLLNRSFRYGDGLFETIRVFRGRPLFLSQHLERLFSGLELLKMNRSNAFFREEVAEQILRLIQLNQLDEHGRIRLHLYRQGEGAYLPTQNSPGYLIEGFALKHDYYSRSAAVSICPFREVELAANPLSKVKSANSLPYILAALFAKEQGYEEGILFHQGFVSEASSANVFVVKKQKLLTPGLESGCLPGIMRQEIIQLSRRLKIPVQEKRIRWKDLLQAEEIFLTNAIRGIIGVNKVENRTFSNSQSAMTAFLRKCFLQYISEIHGKF